MANTCVAFASDAKLVQDLGFVRQKFKREIMGRGVSSGGGQSSLGYLFGSGEAPPAKPTLKPTEVPRNQAEAANTGAPQNATTAAPATAAAAPPAEVKKQIPAGVPGNKANNYFRADGQNCGNFLTV